MFSARKLFEQVMRVSNLWHVEVLTFELDSLLSQSTQKNIIEYVRCFYNEGYNPVSVVEALSEQYPCVQSASMRHNGDAWGTLFVSAYKPIALLNDEMLISAEGRLLPKSFYQPWTGDALHADLAMINAKKLALLVSDSSMHALLDTYAITIESIHTITLYDAKRSLYIRGTSQLLQNKDLVARCIALQDRVKQERALQNKRVVWNVDARFENQLIISTGKGGALWQSCLMKMYLQPLM